MINLILNNQKYTANAATTLADFLSAQNIATNNLIIEYNGEIIRDPQIMLTDNAQINLFKIVAGG